MDKIVTLTKVVDYWDKNKFYYYVTNGYHRLFFYRLVDAEKYIKKIGAKYEFEEIKADLV